MKLLAVPHVWNVRDALAVAEVLHVQRVPSIVVCDREILVDAAGGRRSAAAHRDRRLTQPLNFRSRRAGR